MSDSFSTPRLDAMTTRWSLLRQAHGTSMTSAVDARRVLVLRYAPAIKSYIRGITRDEADADELTQDAVVRLMKGDFAGADPNRGRFRDFLKMAVRNMVKNHWAKEKRQSLRDVEIDVVASAKDVAADPWEEGWKNRILELGWAALRDYEKENPQSRAATVLRLRADYPDESSDQLAARLSQQVGEDVRADAFRQKLRRARVQFAECLVREIADGLEAPNPEQIEDELIALGLLKQIRSLLPEDWTIGKAQ